MKDNVLSPDKVTGILQVLNARFIKFKNRHESVDWADVANRLIANPKKLWSVYQMEATGGEPDVVGVDEVTGEYLFVDCAPESPKDRRSWCYDKEALDSRKENKPKGDAISAAAAMGVSLLSEEQYRYLQTLGEFDLKTSSWIRTPGAIRNLGGALFADRRYNAVFVYHNGASSYYAARGFRALLKV